jgi:DNA-directed RNA polymerase specialized sigma24 family protein
MSEPLEDLLRLQLMLLKRDAPSQKALILEMSSVGFSIGRIAELLGVPYNSVSGVLSKSKAKAVGAET